MKFRLEEEKLDFESRISSGMQAKRKIEDDNKRLIDELLQL